MAWITLILAVLQAIPAIIDIIKLIMSETKDLPKEQQAAVRAEVRKIITTHRSGEDAGQRLRNLIDAIRKAR
jgi:hypothetical protein